MPIALPTPGATPLPSTGMLDAPPPSPQLVGMGRMAGLAPALPISSGGLPPEVTTGIQDALTKMRATLEALAQMTPDLSADWAAVDIALGNVMGKLQVAGAAPAAPSAAGTPFPGGGFEATDRPAGAP